MRRNSQKGSSIIEALISIAILATIVVALITNLEKRQEYTAAVAIVGKLEDLRTLVRKNFSCQRTAAAAGPCSAGTVVVGRNWNGGGLIGVPESLFAKRYHVRVVCAAGLPRTFNVQVRVTTIQGAPIRNVLAGIAPGWNDLMSGVPIACP